MGKVGGRLPNWSDRKKEVLPNFKSLAQEVEFEVRAAVCFQLAAIAKGINTVEIRETILPILLELCNDDDVRVRTAGLEALIILSPQFDSETIRTTVLPFTLSFFRESLNGNTNALPAISQSLGKFCTSFAMNLNHDEKQFCIECFKRFCILGAEGMQKSSPSQSKNLNTLSFFNVSKSLTPNDLESRPIICRGNAGTIFPTMIQFCGVSRFKQDLKTCLSSLCSDSSANVRSKVATSFIEVIRSLGSEAHLVTKDFACLLDDSNLDVLEGIVPNLANIFILLGRNNFRIPPVASSKPSNSGIVLTSLLNCDQTLARTLRWRLHEQLINAFQCLPRICSSDVIYQKIIPVLFNRLSASRQLPLKQTCIQTILILIRSLDKYDRWLDVFQRLQDEFLSSSNSYRRSLFFDMCNMVLEMYSRAFFKANCLEISLRFATDQVPMMRVRLCQLMLKAKATLRLPGDRALLQAIESTVRRLVLNEKDRNISSTIIALVEKMDKVEVKLAPLNRATLNNNNNNDDEDRGKEEEEEKVKRNGEEKDHDESKVDSHQHQQHAGQSSKTTPPVKYPMPKTREGIRANSRSTQNIALSSSSSGKTAATTTTTTTVSSAAGTSATTTTTATTTGTRAKTGKKAAAAAAAASSSTLSSQQSSSTIRHNSFGNSSSSSKLKAGKLKILLICFIIPSLATSHFFRPPFRT